MESMAVATARQMTEGCEAAIWAAKLMSLTCRSLRCATDARRARSDGERILLSTRPFS